MGVVVVSGGCCIPGMVPLDARAQQLVAEAAAATGVAVQLTVLPATSAFLGGAAAPQLARLIGEFNESGRIGLPLVLVEGEPVGSGLPALEQLTAALEQAAANRNVEGAAR
ncbi:MAG: hypothetical protein KGJ43_04220 [Acidobacteriota bacterium]|nr:hypothetical protein [Acidobacteriota bacterium]